MRKNNCIFAGISGFLLVLLLSVCSLDSGSPRRGDEGPPNVDSPPEIIADLPPALLEMPSVHYDSLTAAVSVAFNFNMEVTFTGIDGWDITEDNGGKSLTLNPREAAGLIPGIPATVRLTAGNRQDPAKTIEVQADFMPVAAVFKRPAAAAEYQLVYYDGNSTAGLVSGGITAWYYIADSGLQRIFNAIYSPNAPGNGPDALEMGKAPIPYTAELSEKVIGLFNVLIAPDSTGDKIKIKGIGLPAATGPYRIVVIDIGVPGEDNAALPDFYIPYRELGTPGEDYSHIRFRVNQGAYLRIEADNSDYIARGDSCPYGYLTGASVEIMGDGKLRGGAYRGFPLGQGTAIIARLGSWFARGPESSFSPEKAGYNEDRDKRYRGWLLGPSRADPGILWNGGDQNGSYIEIREGRLAFDVNVTIRKSLVLMCSVWFINGPTVTIAAANNSLEINGKKGLFAGGNDYRFYGTLSVSGGQNPAMPAAKIIVKEGNSLSTSFLTNAPEAVTEFITASGEKTINNKGRIPDSLQQVYYEETSRGGYLSWDFQ